MTAEELKKIAELENRILRLESMVKQLAGRVDYLDRERVRTKNSINTLSSEIKRN
jgi:hypothetical protein